MGVRNTTQRRRRNIFIAKIVGAVLLGILLVILVATTTSERIKSYRIDAAVQPDGSTLVRETIEYDFGVSSKHGIFRFFPGYYLSEAGGGSNVISELRVRSASAPDDLNLASASSGELKVGSPDIEVTGRHEYVISYRLPPNLGAGPGAVALDVIGTEWQVPIEEVDARITLPADLTSERCVRGQAGDNTSCEGLSSEGRTLVLTEKDLDDHEGITVYAQTATAGDPTVLPPEPALSPGDPHWYVRDSAPFIGLALLGYLLALFPVAAYARRLGRDWAWDGGGGAVDAVFGGPGLETRRIDDSVAEGQVTIQFVPPPDLTPAQGGIVLRERVTDSHKVAWLMDYSLSGWIAVENEGKQLRWTARDDRWAQAPVPLRTMFTGRHIISLSSYDKEFAEGWSQITTDLDEFKRTSGLWDDEAAAHARRRVNLIALVAVPVVIICAVIAVFTLRSQPLLTAGIGAILGLAFGAGFAAVANRGELQVRSPKGFSQRQLTEGFRRFFQTSETRHVVAAAEKDQLRLYSAWAVALDEVDNWDRMIKSAQLPANTTGVSDLVYVSAFSSAARSATVAPSSSSSGGGGGGGSVGGGGGGGGGGSW